MSRVATRDERNLYCLAATGRDTCAPFAACEFHGGECAVEALEAFHAEAPAHFSPEAMVLWRWMRADARLRALAAAQQAFVIVASLVLLLVVSALEDGLFDALS